MSTDKTIEITCGECSAVAEGIDSMFDHVAKCHGDTYRTKEDYEIVQDWLEDAYEKEKEFLSDYYQQRKLDKAIDADAFPNK